VRKERHCKEIKEADRNIGESGLEPRTASNTENTHVPTVATGQYNMDR